MAKLQLYQLSNELLGSQTAHLPLICRRHIPNALPQFRNAEFQPIEANGGDADIQKFRNILIRQEWIRFEFLQKPSLPFFLLMRFSAHNSSFSGRPIECYHLIITSVDSIAHNPSHCKGFPMRKPRQPHPA